MGEEMRKDERKRRMRIRRWSHSRKTGERGRGRRSPTPGQNTRPSSA